MSEFSMTVGQLRALFESRESLDTLKEHGSLKGLCEKLNVNPEKGISASSIPSRQAKYGENKVPERPPTAYYELLLEALKDFTILMLIAAAVLSIFVCLVFDHSTEDDSTTVAPGGGACAVMSGTGLAAVIPHKESEEELCWAEGVAIIFTVLLVSNVAAMQDYQKEKQFRLLNADVENVQINVIRDGENTVISKNDLVVGDIVRLSIGDILEGDGVLVEGFDVEADESALTGEPILIKKTDEAPFIFSGSSIQNGQGKYMIIAVGVNSEKGRIQALVRGQTLATDDTSKKGAEAAIGEEEEESSLLTQKLDKVANLIGKLATAVALFALVGMAANYFIDRAFDDNATSGSAMGKELSKDATQWVVVCITIVVVAVPEGLPLAVTLALSLSVRKMQDDQCLVKHLDSTETMGSATTICTDKTGTLTQNRMTVVKGYFGGDIVETSGSLTCGMVLKNSGKADADYFERLCRGVVVNKAEAEIRWNEVINRWDQIGNKTDCALLAFANDLGYDYRKSGFKMAEAVKIYPFSSARKRAGIIVPAALSDSSGNDSKKYRIYVKGASEIVLSLCSKAYKNGVEEDLSTEGKRDIIEKVVTPFAKASLRTIALAYREVQGEHDWEEKLSEEQSVELTGQNAESFKMETGLTLLALVGIEDPLRDTVPAAIAKCNRAGVDVRMVTGDNIDTAIAISKQCGILRATIDLDPEGNPKNNSAMTGPDFRKKVLTNDGRIDQAEFDKIWPTLRVLARSSPTDKYYLVAGMNESSLFEDAEAVKKYGIYPDRQVVAVTGDGTNDAPALKRADVGFVMGLTGTSVAKDASDIIILDDDFASIVQACLWGRNVYDCISKFLQFQLTVNICAVTFACTGAFVDRGSPLRAVQMLWVNLIMDSLGALALASEPPVPELLMRPPYGRNRDLLSFQMRFNMLGQSFYQMFILLTLYFAGAGDKLPGWSCPLLKSENCYLTAGMTAATISSICGKWKEYDHCDVREYKNEFCNKIFGGDTGCGELSEEIFCPKCGGIFDIPSGRGRAHDSSPTQHYSMIFNTFVMLQLFNWLNCRKIYHESNVLEGILDNKTFCIIWILCFCIQIILVEFGGIGKNGLERQCKGEFVFFSSTHLTTVQFLVSFLLGLGSLAWQMVLITIVKEKIPD